MSKNVKSIINMPVFSLFVISLILSRQLHGLANFNESSDSLGYISQQNDYHLRALVTIDQELSGALHSPERIIYLLLRKCEIYLQMSDFLNANIILDYVDERRKTIFRNICLIDFLYAINKGLLMNMKCQDDESQKWLEKAKSFLKSNDSIPEIDVASVNPL